MTDQIPGDQGFPEQVSGDQVSGDQSPTAQLPVSPFSGDRSPAERSTERAVAGAFAAYRDESRGTFPAPPPAAVFAVARRRHQQRRVATGLAAALVASIVASGAVLAQTINDPEGPQVAGPPATAGAARSASESPTPQSPATGSGDSRHPGGNDRPRIDLRNATIELPAWPGGACPSGSFRFSDGEAATSDGRYRILPNRSAAHYANLDGKSGSEVLARIQCGTGDEWVDGVVALRVAGDDAATAMAYVVTLADGGQVTDIDTDGSVVTVTVEEQSTTERRRFRWNGERFAPVERPTESPDPDPESPSPDPGGPTTPPPVSPSHSSSAQGPDGS